MGLQGLAILLKEDFVPERGDGRAPRLLARGVPGPRHDCHDCVIGERHAFREQDVAEKDGPVRRRGTREAQEVREGRTLGQVIVNGADAGDEKVDEDLPIGCDFCLVL